MADVVSAGNGRLAFWSNMDMESSEDSDALVPGVNVPGNKRPTRIHVRKTREVQAKIPLKQPVVENLIPISKQISQEIPCASERKTKHVRRPSLKDLCVEDKTRIASLIKELARVGDEREVAVGQLHHERRSFETQVLQLVSQQEQILKEREDVQNKLFECQNLLTKYQDKLLNKQEKLKASINKNKDEATQYSVIEERGRRPKKQLYEKGPQSSDEELELNSAFTELPHQHFIDKKEPNCESRRQPPKFTKPVTSMIDREIALERSGESSGRSGENSPRTLPERRKESRIQDLPTKRNIPPNRFREPIMSSTQKSSDINNFIPHDANSDILRMDERSESPLSSVRAHSPRTSEQDERQSRGRVIFKERIECDDDNVKMYSPNLQKGLSGDEDFVTYYRKLTPNERKRELLRQREALLDEQKHLRQILLDQEDQLQLKQQQLERKHKEQKQRLEYFEQKIEMSPAFNQNANFVAVGECKGVLSPCEALQSPKSQMHVCDEDVESSIARDINIAGSPQVRSRLSVATSPIADSPVNRVSMATSPIQMSSPSLLLNGASPRLIDVATSISYRSPRSPLINQMDRQGNLPFRQKSSPAALASASVTPGEKTLSVVEIVNSLDDQIAQLDGSFIGNHISPSRARTSPSKLQPSPQHQNFLFNKADDDELEESQILDEVFFLK